MQITILRWGYCIAISFVFVSYYLALSILALFLVFVYEKAYQQDDERGRNRGNKYDRQQLYQYEIGCIESHK